jgi:hypothetical protein
MSVARIQLVNHRIHQIDFEIAKQIIARDKTIRIRQAAAFRNSSSQMTLRTD